MHAAFLDLSAKTRHPKYLQWSNDTRHRDLPSSSLVLSLKLNSLLREALGISFSVSKKRCKFHRGRGRSPACFDGGSVHFLSREKNLQI